MTINFSLLALDQIVNHAAKIYGMFGGQASVPMVIRTPGGGGQQLGATHSQNVELFYSFIPGLKVVAPSTPADAKAMLKAAIRDDDPVLFLENLALYNTKGEVPRSRTSSRPRSAGAAVTRPGTDITLIGYSRMARGRRGGRRVARRRGRLRRGGGPAQPAPAGPRDHRRVGPQDRPRRGRRGRLAHLRHRRRDRRDDPGGRVRLAGRAGPPGRDGGGAAALRQVPGDGRAAVRRRRCSPPSATRSARPAERCRGDRHDRDPHAPPLRHHGGGRHQLLAEAAGGRGRGRRRPRRHRDRQGGHGVRGVRGRRPRGDPRARGRVRRDRHAHRRDHPGRRRGSRRGRGTGREGRGQEAEAEEAPAAKAEKAEKAEARGRAGTGRRSRGRRGGARRGRRASGRTVAPAVVAAGAQAGPRPRHRPDTR